jgi:hypothetical protein
MAYFSQENKKIVSAKLKPVLAAYGIKGSLSVRHHSTVVLNIKSGKIDFISNFNKVANENHRSYDNFRPAKDHIDVNPYWYQAHFDSQAKKFFDEVFSTLNAGNHNNSDIQTDYFDVGWYVDVNIGTWNKPYILETVL